MRTGLVKARHEEGYRRWWKRCGEVPEMWVKQAIRKTKQRATRNGLECTITAKELLPLPEICPLLGIHLDYSKGGKGRGGFRNDSPSLDRIDNSKGYVPGNVWIISYRANSIKRDATLGELQDIAAILGHAVETRLRGKRYQ